ncbi:hypothetical protein KSP40_PGU014468 [Platanthera guangdongensis]|uniref:Uncharacterized protein n=1 Tax=Platanthera guangdongensis TaxID=2320717 RepID=A0ABR2MEH9_9ASPA
MKNVRALLLIQQGQSNAIFTHIMGATSAKNAWAILKKSLKGRRRLSKIPGSKYLSFRCSSKSFTVQVTPLVNMLSEDSKEALRLAYIQDFVKYNWPQTIHGFLHSQFDGLSKICEVRGAGENIGYLEGCSTVLLVITTFANVGDDELSLLGVEELESDFETGPEKKEKRKMDVKVDSLDYESEKEKKMKYKKQEKKLLKKIRSEIKKEMKGNVKSDEGWRGMEARLKSYIKSEVEGLKTFCEYLFLKFQAGLKCTPTPSPPPHSTPSPHSPIMTSVSPTPLSQPASTLECTLVSPTQIHSQELVSRTPRKGFLRAKTVSRRTFQKGQIIEYEPDYPGRLHVPDKTRKPLIQC